MTRHLNRVTGGVRVVAAGCNDKGRPTYRLASDRPADSEGVAATIGRPTPEPPMRSR